MGTRPLGISPAYMENREEDLQSKGLEHVRAVLATVNCRLIVQHVAMSTPYLGNRRPVPAAVAGEAQCQACNPYRQNEPAGHKIENVRRPRSYQCYPYHHYQ